MIGFGVTEPTARVLSRMAAHNVRIAGPAQTAGMGNFLHMADPDGNEIYFREKPVISEAEEQAEQMEREAFSAK